jgi:hypothetical protein
MDEQEAPQYEGSPELFMFLASTVHDMKNSISVLSGTLENLLAAHPSTSAPNTARWRTCCTRPSASTIT